MKKNLIWNDGMKVQIEKCWDDGWLWNPKTYSFDRILRLESGRMILQGSVYQPKELE